MGKLCLNPFTNKYTTFFYKKKIFEKVLIRIPVMNQFFQFLDSVF